MAAVEDCFAEADSKGVEYVWAEVKQEGRSAAEVRAGGRARVCFEGRVGVRTGMLSGGVQTGQRSHGQRRDAECIPLLPPADAHVTHRLSPPNACLPARLPLQVLTEELPALVGGISFRKSMRWRPEAASSRPLRWLLALHGDVVVPFSYAGLQGGE